MRNLLLGTLRQQSQFYNTNQRRELKTDTVTMLLAEPLAFLLG